MLRCILVLTFILICSSCSNSIDTTNDNSQTFNIKQPEKCSASPPVLDRQKIIEMLRNIGKITSDMNTEEVEHVVTTFINNKYKASKGCK